MHDKLDYALMLRFRDLVTEPGGNIAEHRKIIRQRGYVWWGWWARKHEAIPVPIFKQLLPTDNASCEVILFDTGLLRCFRTKLTKIIVSPSDVGVGSPDFEATPEHYVRGRYPAWFRLEGDILPVDKLIPQVVARPTTAGAPRLLEPDLAAVATELNLLNDERPTLWIVSQTGMP